MKKSFIIFSLLLLGLSSCGKDWFDVNTNPDSANNTVPRAEQRLAPILAQFNDAYESMGTRMAFLGQQITRTYASTNSNYMLTQWRSTPGGMAWPWQAWYVNCSVNIPSLIEAAQKVEAHHYVGVAKIIYAMGFISLSDVYGVMPYGELPTSQKDPNSQAFDPAIVTPAFMQGKDIYDKCMVLLDEAIQDLQKEQVNTLAPTLSYNNGDIWNSGNVDKWIKCAYGLKARFLNHQSKLKGTDAAFNQSILDALAKGPQVNGDNTCMQYIDEGINQPRTDWEALQYTNLGTTGRVTKFYMDLLTNTFPGGTGVEDPRLDSLVPSFQSIDPNDPSKLILIRTKPVDMTSDKVKNGPDAYSYYAAVKKYLKSYDKNTKKETPTEDTMYVQMRKEYDKTDNRLISTGTWYSKRGALAPFVTCYEMNFIKAETLYRMGQKDQAQQAYKKAIEQHMELLNVPSADAQAFLSSAAVAQSGSELTISHIMMQKYIAMSFSPENFVDLRRYDYCTNASGVYDESVGVYKGWKRPSIVYELAYPSQTDWPRRTTTASYEVNYNAAQFEAIEPDGQSDTYMTKPVWWDAKN